MNRRQFLKKALFAVACAKAGSLLAKDVGGCASGAQNLGNAAKAEAEAETKKLTLDTLECIGCQCCCPCPAGVDIPRVFELYNGYKKSGDKQAFVNEYNKLNEDEKASACVSCERCLDKCPQSINIPAALSLIAEQFG